MSPKQTYKIIVYLPYPFLLASKIHSTINHLAKLNVCSKQCMSAPGKASAHTAQVEDVCERFQNLVSAILTPSTGKHLLEHLAVTSISAHLQTAQISFTCIAMCNSGLNKKKLSWNTEERAAAISSGLQSLF